LLPNALTDSFTKQALKEAEIDEEEVGTKLENAIDAGIPEKIEKYEIAFKRSQGKVSTLKWR